MSCGRKIGPYDCCSVVEGDCLELMKALPDGCVDAVITDPPYGVGIKYAQYSDTLRATTEMVTAFVDAASRIARVVAFTVGKWDTELELYRTRPPRWRMCWYKGAQSTASAIGFNDWEAVLIYGNDVYRYAHDYFYAMPEEMGAFGHPCPKPEPYALTLVNRLTKLGNVVLDPFMGSGTTAVAAAKLGRHFLGFEISPEYCAIARKRIALVEAQPNLFQPKAEQLNMEGL
jgi:DNA modification methylase